MKNEYGLDTVNGYVVIPNQEYWKQYKNYFGTSVKAGWSMRDCYHNGHSPEYPESYPCIVSTEWYEDNDNYRYWSHSFIYKYDILSQLEAFNTVEQELGIMNRNYCTICGKRIDDCECDLWEN